MRHMFAAGQHTRGQPGAVLGRVDGTTIEAIKRNPQREATGATVAPTPADRRILYPSGVASKNIMAAAIPTFQPPRPAKPHENRNGYKLEFDTGIYLSPSLLRAPRFEALSAHPRDPGRNGFLTWGRQHRKSRLASARARGDATQPPLLSALVGVISSGAWCVTPTTVIITEKSVFVFFREIKSDSNWKISFPTTTKKTYIPGSLYIYVPGVYVSLKPWL